MHNKQTNKRSCFFDFCLRGEQSGRLCWKRVFSTFLYKAFSVEMPETSFLKCNKPKGWWTANRKYFFSHFDLIGCESSKRCAKLTILKIKVMIRVYKWRQKIPWVQFAGNDISNYGLISNTHGARDQNIIFMKNSNFFLESVVERPCAKTPIYFGNFVQFNE
jgi:hypothetical protein